MGRLKTHDERLAKKMKNKVLTKRAMLCKTGHHQEDPKTPGICIHCKVKKSEDDHAVEEFIGNVLKDCKDMG